MVLGLNRILTREQYVEMNALTPEMAEQVFRQVKPIQIGEDGSPRYLEGMVDRAVEEIYRPSVNSGASVWGQENPHMDTLSRQTDALNRIAEFLERLGPKEDVKEKPIPEMLTPEKASKAMHQHVQTVTKWCRKGKIRATKLGRKWLIPKEEVDRHLRRDCLIKGPRKEAGK